MGLRILFDSHDPKHKSPFGTVVPKELCAFSVSIPTEVRTTAVHLVFRCDRTGQERAVALGKTGTEGDYEQWGGEVSFPEPDLYFYWFEVRTETGSFRLLKYGDHDTNMEAGDLWQLSCVTAEYPAPDWARGAILYQIMPDRFCRRGNPDLTDKLQPYTVHASTEEMPDWKPTAEGKVLNNDFFGGTLQGITSKMRYLASLGVGVLYLNPVFMAFSNHRYDTCDYKRIDPMLGTEKDFVKLCKTAHKFGIRVVLDGVFSHTGSNSVYFDKEKIFGNGAYSNTQSPYLTWFKFRKYPDEYVSWWDFDTLPCVDKMHPDYIDFIIEAEDSVIAHWLRLGADGFRLDVVDELPDEFVARMRRKMREINPESMLLGEVWEDASNKEAYGIRRRYFVDGELDGVMNYPWRTAILNFCRGNDGGFALKSAVERIWENYPRQAMDCTMNLISSHDRPRALTELAAPFEGCREDMAKHKLSTSQRENGMKMLKMAAILQYSLPGMPSIYYGDEAGMEGCKDPFNRGFYPWGNEDKKLVEFYKKLGKLRNSRKSLRLGDVKVTTDGNGNVTVRREYEDEVTEISVDREAGIWCLNGEKEEL